MTTSIAIVRVEAPEGAHAWRASRASGQRNLRKAYGPPPRPARRWTCGSTASRALQLDYTPTRRASARSARCAPTTSTSLSFTAARSAFKRRVADFDALLRSWRWQSGDDAE